MNSIDKVSLEILIKNHGILLEHQTENTISSYLKGPNCSIISSNVSHRLYSDVKKDYVEIDVFTEAEIQYQRMTLKIKPRDSNRVFNYESPPFKTNVIFIVQCKGHSSSGFLLCRSLEMQESYYHSEIMIDRQKDHEIITKKKGVNIVDWSYFYKVNEGQIKKIQKGKVTEIVYQEDRDKFYKGMEQINESIVTYYDTYNSDSKSKKVIKIVPLIVTNSPIYLMRIRNSEVTFHEVPWVLQVNYYKPDEQLVYDEIYRKCFEYIHVVQHKELNILLNIILDIEKDFSYPEKYNKLFHSFNIY